MIEKLRELYLDDLTKTVTYGDREQSRVKNPGKWRNLEAQVSLAESVEQPIVIGEEQKVWLWSDLHFFHKNIIEFSNRPFMNLEEMHEHLVDNFNEYVGENDISVWGGDIGFCGATIMNEILDKLNGYKILVVGNHDFNKKKLRNLNFDETHLLYLIETPEVDLLVTHYPMENLPWPYINVHGHLHIGGHELNSLQHININCEYTEYKPIELTEVIRMAKMRVDEHNG